MKKGVIQLLEELCNANAMVTTWQLWMERSLPDQSSYVESVYQQRDAYNHLITMLAQGIMDGFYGTNVASTDFDGFFQSEQVEQQLTDAYDHVKRAFFDCADYIYLKLNEICASDKNSFNLLRFIMDKTSQKIDVLRDSKSSPGHSSYKKMEEWAEYLCLFSAAYSLEDYISRLKKSHYAVLSAIKKIEIDYSKELIMSCRPDFYVKSTQITTEGKKFLDDLSSLLSVKGSFFSSVPFSPEIIIDEWKAKMENQMELDTKNLADYEYLYKSIASHDSIENKKNKKRMAADILEKIVAPVAALLVAGIYQLISNAFTGSVVSGVSFITIGIALGIFIIGQIIASSIRQKSK